MLKSATKTNYRLPGLDGIRGLAVAWVVFCHVYPWDESLLGMLAARGGYGVQIFFVLSGFIITNLLLREEANFGKVSLANFYLRRSVRILPVVCVFLLSMLALDVAGFIDIPALDYVSSLTFWRNFEVSANRITGHLWSLSVEEQFYILWPVLFVVARKRTLRIILCVTLLIVARTAVSVLPNLGVPRHVVAKANYAPIMTGALLAVLVYDRKYPPRIVNGMGLVAVPILIACISVYGTGSSAVNLFASMLGYACIAAVIYAAAYGNEWLARAMEWKPLKLLGLVSYSLYVWQQPFCFWPGGLTLWAKAVAIAGCTLVSYWLVERPTMRLSKRFFSVVR